MSTIASGLNDDIIAQRALEGFVNELAPLNSFSTSFSAEATRKGSTVSVPLISNITATNFSANVGYEGTGGSMTEVSVALDQHKIATVDLTDLQFANSSVAEIERFGFQQGRAVAQAVISSVWGLFTTTNFGAPAVTVTAASFTLTHVRNLRTALSKAKVPKTDRALFLDSDYFDRLLADSTVAAAYAYGGSEAIRDGRVPSLYGFSRVEESLLVPLNGCSLYGFAVHPSAVAVAVRVLEPQAPGEYLATQIVTEPASGISLGYRRHYNPGTGKHYISFECVFGHSVGISAGAKLLVSG